MDGDDSDGDKFAKQMEQLDLLVGQLWHQIVKSMNHVLNADRSYGFSGFVELANPSIEEILQAIQFVDPAITTVINHPHINEHPERMMAMLNCQQSVLLIRRTSVALKTKDQSEYEDCIRMLLKQRP